MNIRFTCQFKCEITNSNEVWTEESIFEKKGSHSCYKKIFLSPRSTHLFSPNQAYFIKISLNYFLQSSFRRYIRCASRNLKSGQQKFAILTHAF